MFSGLFWLLTSLYCGMCNLFVIYIFDIFMIFLLPTDQVFNPLITAAHQDGRFQANFSGTELRVRAA